MRIGILGAGNMARALGRRWAAAGHQIVIGGRSARRAGEAVVDVGGGAVAGSLRDAGSFGEVVLLAVGRVGVTDALAAAGAGQGALRGRTLIDCTNPIDEADTFRLVTADGPAMARTVAVAAPGALVTKAFNLGSAGLWARTSRTGPTAPVAVPVATDSRPAFEATSELVRALACTPLWWGPLERAGQLEALAAVGIRLIVEGLGFDDVMPTAQPGPPPGASR